MNTALETNCYFKPVDINWSPAPIVVVAAPVCPHRQMSPAIVPAIRDLRADSHPGLSLAPGPHMTRVRKSGSPSLSRSVFSHNNNFLNRNIPPRPGSCPSLLLILSLCVDFITEFLQIDLRPSRMCNLVNSLQLVFMTCKYGI